MSLVGIRQRARLAGAVLVLVASACSGGRQRAPEPPIPADVLVLEVDNRNWSDVLVWIEHDGVRTRFMMINASRSVTRPIPPHLVSANGTLRLIAHRIGGGNDYYVSPTISVRTGYTVAFTIDYNIQRSSVGVW